jgi:hypothetical protein
VAEPTWVDKQLAKLTGTKLWQSAEDWMEQKVRDAWHSDFVKRRFPNTQLLPLGSATAEEWDAVDAATERSGWRHYDRNMWDAGIPQTVTDFIPQPLGEGAENVRARYMDSGMSHKQALAKLNKFIKEKRPDSHSVAIDANLLNMGPEDRDPRDTFAYPKGGEVQFERPSEANAMKRWEWLQSRKPTRNTWND